MMSIAFPNGAAVKGEARKGMWNLRTKDEYEGFLQEVN